MTAAAAATPVVGAPETNSKAASRAAAQDLDPRGVAQTAQASQQLLLGFTQTSTSPPDDRMPPVEPGHGQVQPADPVVLSLQVRQLMCDQGRLLASGKVRPELGRHKQLSPATERPEHGWDSTRHQPSGRDTSQSELTGHRADSCLQVGRCGLNVPEQALEADDPHGRQRPADQGAGEDQRQGKNFPARKIAQGDRGRVVLCMRVLRMRPFCLVGCGSEAGATARLTQFRVSGRDRGLNALSSSIPLTLSGLTVVLDQVGGQFLPIWPRRQGEPGSNVDGPWWT